MYSCVVEVEIAPIVLHWAGSDISESWAQGRVINTPHTPLRYCSESRGSQSLRSGSATTPVLSSAVNFLFHFHAGGGKNSTDRRLSTKKTRPHSRVPRPASFRYCTQSNGSIYLLRSIHHVRPRGPPTSGEQSSEEKKGPRKQLPP